MGYLNKLKKAIYVSAFVMACSIAFAASAKDWEKLPDGRVVIEVGKVKLALVATGDYLEETQFYLDKGILAMIPGGEHVMTVSLKDVIAYPDESRRAFAATLDPNREDARPFRLSFGRNFDKHETKFQEKFDYSKMADIWGTVSYTMVVGESDIPYEKRTYMQNDVIACATKNVKPYNKNGLIQEHLEPYSESMKDFCLPAEKRLFKTKFSARFHCVDIGGVSCNSFLLTSTGDIRAYYSFFAEYKNKDGNIRGFSPDKWPELDRQMQEAFSYVIVHSPHGALQ